MTSAATDCATSPPQTASVAEERTIVFFDGVCGLCNRTVTLLLDYDRRRRLLFAPLQGETARQLLPQADFCQLNSLVLLERGRLSRESAAAVRILWLLGGVLSALGCAVWLIPKPLRDIAYRAIAARRYRLFGQLESCRMPTGDEQSRFLP